jgi:ligand-binding sensor domain-containing protein/GAF domain-containing protein
VCALAAALAATTPLVALPADRAVTQYLRRSWSLPEGLPAVAIAGLAEDPSGALWLATAEGLVRFDGVEMTVLDRANTPAMGFSEVRSVVVDPHGAIWVAVAFSGVMRCQGAGHCEAIGPPGWDFRRLALGPDGTVWAYGNGVWRFPQGRPERLSPLDEAAPLQNFITFDRNGRLWLAGDRGEVVLADPRGPTRLLGQWQAPGSEVGPPRVTVDRDGGVLLTIADEVRRCAPDQPDRCSLLLAIRRPTDLLRDRDGNLWVASQGGEGLVRIDPQGNRQTLFGEMLPGQRLLDLHEDREGNLWVATWDGGLLRLTAGAFATFGRPEGLPVEAVRVVVEDARGTLFAGTDAGLLERRGDTWRLWPYADGASERPRWVLALAATADGELFAGTSSGLARRLGERLERVPLGPTDGAVYGLHRDPLDRVWASLSHGFPTETWRLAPPDRTPRAITNLPDLAYDFARDQAGRMWAATRLGAARESEDGSFARVALPTALERDVLFTVDVDRRGDVWLGGLDRGLTRVRPDGTAHTLTTRDGLVNDSVHAVLEDDAGRLWVSSSKGIYWFAPADVDRYLAGSLPRLPTTVFDESDGLRTRATSGGSQPAAWKARDGRLWFATNRGLSVVDPQRLPTLTPPSVRITSVRTDQGSHDPQQPIVLPPGRHRVEVGWSAVALGAPEKLRFRYRLDETGSSWTEVGTRRTLELAALGRGRHPLAIAASLDGNHWGTPAAIVIEVTPAAWERAWFWSSSFLFACGLVVGGVRLRLARAARRELETRRELEALVAFGREVTGLLDPSAIGQRLLAALARRFGPAATLLLAHREGREPLVAGSAAGAFDGPQRTRLLDAAAQLERPRRLAGDRAAGTNEPPSAPAPVEDLATPTAPPHQAPAVAGAGPGDPLADLAGHGLTLVVPLASGSTPIGLLALGQAPGGNAYSQRDVAHLAGLAAHVAAALEGAWQAQEAVRWRELSEARREWSEQDLVGRLVFAAVTRGGFDGPLRPAAVSDLLASATGGEVRFGAGAVARAIDRLCETGVLERQDDGALHVARLRWLLLPEVRQPLAELARGASRTVGAYRLQERLGAGGMAEVFRAVNVHDGSPAAVKLLRADEAGETEARRRLEREGELVAAIHHPHLVRLLARGEHEGRLYLAMELLAGETLAARLRRGPLALAEVLHAGRDVAAALAELHRHGVVHRDVKPANIMAEPDGRHVLLDLGLARGLGASTLTQAESVLGTLRYMSPEALRGEPLGPASDLWSLGVTLHELATGGFPWPGTDTLQVALDLARATVAPTLAAAVPASLAGLLARLLDPDPARRLGSAEELLAALRSAGPGAPAGAGPVPAPGAEPRPTPPAPQAVDPG